MDEKKKGTPLPNTGFGPETLTNILDTLKNFKSSEGLTLASLLQGATTQEKSNNTIMLPINKITEICESSDFNKNTLIKYILSQDKVVVQNDKDLHFWTNYTGLVQYPNLYKEAYLIAKPRLTNDGIVFDIDEPLPEGSRLGIMAFGISDEQLARSPEEETPFAGCVVKLYVINAEKSNKGD